MRVFECHKCEAGASLAPSGGGLRLENTPLSGDVLSEVLTDIGEGQRSAAIKRKF